ncbi:MAG: L-serine ammonia-lyase, partial [Myxococcaceae bacterium]
MSVSVFDLFKIGIGPSSSHTVGPMRAARTFVVGLSDAGLLERVTRLKVELFGSLGATGKGHGSDKAVLLGLRGDTPEDVDVELVPSLVAHWRAEGRVSLLQRLVVPFRDGEHLVMHKRKVLPYHPNGMRFTAFGEGG